MDPILEEMARAREVRDGSLRRWVEHLSALLAAKDAEIADLREQLTRKGRAA